MPKRRSKGRHVDIVANADAKRRMLELAKSLFDKGLIDARELAKARKNARFCKQVDTVRGRTPAMDAFMRVVNGSDRYTVENSLRAFDTASGHVTPADGNVFADLEFAPDAAAALLIEADARINAAPAIERSKSILDLEGSLKPTEGLHVQIEEMNAWQSAEGHDLDATGDDDAKER